MKSKTGLLTLADKIYKGLKAQHTQFKPIMNVHRFIILKESSIKSVTFKELKLSCATSDGNLSQHTRAMEDEGLLEVIKKFVDKRPQTSYRITTKGMNLYIDLEKYLNDLMSTTTIAGDCK